jgi:hypothetical protein
VAALAITCGCNDQDETAGTPVMTPGQQSAAPQPAQPSAPSEGSADTTASVKPSQPASIVAPPPAAVERTFELPSVDPPVPDPKDTVSMPCSIPGSECDPGGETSGEGDATDENPPGGEANQDTPSHSPSEEQDISNRGRSDRGSLTENRSGSPTSGPQE